MRKITGWFRVPGITIVLCMIKEMRNESAGYSSKLSVTGSSPGPHYFYILLKDSRYQWKSEFITSNTYQDFKPHSKWRSAWKEMAQVGALTFYG